MTTSHSEPTTLGTGRLNWRKSERINDRYGAVALYGDDDNADRERVGGSVDPIPFEAIPIEGTWGRLVAEVRETRESYHIGDLFRGIHPTTPAEGDRILLGEGYAFTESHDDDPEGVVHFGLMPHDGRATDWMDPRALYRTHNQTVTLVFEPREAPEGEVAAMEAAPDQMVAVGVQTRHETS